MKYYAETTNFRMPEDLQRTAREHVDAHPDRWPTESDFYRAAVHHFQRKIAEGLFDDV